MISHTRPEPAAHHCQLSGHPISAPDCSLTRAWSTSKQHAHGQLISCAGTRMRTRTAAFAASPLGNVQPCALVRCDTRLDTERPSHPQSRTRLGRRGALASRRWAAACCMNEATTTLTRAEPGAVIQGLPMATRFRYSFPSILTLPLAAAITIVLATFAPY